MLRDARRVIENDGCKKRNRGNERKRSRLPCRNGRDGDRCGDNNGSAAEDTRAGGIAMIRSALRIRGLAAIRAGDRIGRRQRGKQNQ